MLNRQGRTTALIESNDIPTPQTFTGHRGLAHEAPLIFEQGEAGRTGVDLPAIPVVTERRISPAGKHRSAGIKRTTGDTTLCPPQPTELRH